VVVANAGGHCLGSAPDTDDEGWAVSWAANVTWAFLVVREALPDLMANQDAIVVVSSMVGAFAGGWVTGG
jgi:meso-butanediol dehydrogenase/(S,S)-butanediol dehydrogenase/diacetyl reductase